MKQESHFPYTYGDSGPDEPDLSAIMQIVGGLILLPVFGFGVRIPSPLPIEDFHNQELLKKVLVRGYPPAFDFITKLLYY